MVIALSCPRLIRAPAIFSPLLDVVQPAFPLAVFHCSLACFEFVRVGVCAALCPRISLAQFRNYCGRPGAIRISRNRIHMLEIVIRQHIAIAATCLPKKVIVRFHHQGGTQAMLATSRQDVFTLHARRENDECRILVPQHFQEPLGRSRDVEPIAVRDPIRHFGTDVRPVTVHVGYWFGCGCPYGCVCQGPFDRPQ